MRALSTFSLAAAVALAAGATARAADFSPESVFQLPAHKIIDDRCGDARAFADKAGGGTGAIVPLDAVNAAKAFIACAQMQRLTQDADENRYYMLAAATALYVAASKTSPGTTIKLDGNADGIAAQLGGAQPDPMYSFYKVESGAGGRSTATDDQIAANNAGSSETTNRGLATSIVADRNVLKGSGGPVYSDVAGDLRIAIAKAVAKAKHDVDAAAAATPAAPSATPSP